MPTIYTFGDPELLREALLALATIFNLVEWSDPGSAMNLGGNMLAVALIGLVAVGIAGVTSQQVRVDYLFMALILFGIMFGTETDVNVEDIQTGDSAIVADIPIGIAYVAAAASAAGRELTETTSTALQRPGSTTSVITQGGFMDPLKVLLALQNLSFGDVSNTLNKSLLEYYRICVGRTVVTDPTRFDLDMFKTTADPVGFLLDATKVLNFSVTYYSAAAPGGVARSCWAVIPDLQADIDSITTGAVDGIEAYLARALGSENYNTSFDLTDIDDSVDIVFRAGMTGQDFLARLMLRNFHNTGEAWRLAEYGTNQAQYVATVTEAFEGQRSNVALEGSIFLQMMLPLMTFFQFLFFSIAPFIALVMIASPFSAGKTVGFYLLFGVWSYMWMPVAAVINHYMEISMQNAIEFAGMGALNTGHTALLGFDDFYNIAATKLTIGANALAATPIIVGAILTATVMGVSNLAGRFSQAGNANRNNTSLIAPSLGRNQPLANVGGRFSSSVGTTLSPGGGAGAVSGEQRLGYEKLNLAEKATAILTAGNRSLASAQSSNQASISSGIQTLNQIVDAGGFGSSFAQSFSSTADQQIKSAVESAFDKDTAKSLGVAQTRQLGSSLGLHVIGTGAKETTDDAVFNGTQFSDIEKAVKARSGAITAGLASSLSTQANSKYDESGILRETAQSISSSERKLETAQSAQREAAETASSMFELSKSTLADTTDIAELAIRRFGGKGAEAKMSEFLTGNYKGFANDIARGGRKIFEAKRPVGIDGLTLGGKGDLNADSVDTISSQINWLANEAAGGNAKAAHALLAVTNELAGVGPGVGAFANSESTFRGLEGARETVGANGALMDGVATGIDASQQGDAASYDRLSGESASRRARGGKEFPTISADSVNQVQGQFELGKNLANDDSALRSLAPETSGTFDRLGKTQSEVRAGVNAEFGENPTLSASLQDLMKPGSGFTDVLQNDLGPLARADGSLAATDGLADSAVNKLQGAVYGQFSTQTEISGIYQKYQDAGFSKKQAALATYGELGRRTAGASDLFVAGLTGAAGERAGAAAGAKAGLNKSLLSVARIGGAATGVGIFAAGVGVAKYRDGIKADEAARELGELLKADFRQASPEYYDQFAEEIDRQTDIQGVSEVLTNFYESGRLTDQQIDQFKPDKQYIAGNYGFQTVQPKTANPFDVEPATKGVQKGGGKGTE